ncbi:MAG: 1-deoxy-D-xylulose-5-phosphate synthase [Alphaproteobacteria bacterium]|nr:1-deoxy-D-xylulose-5-phosphate synthase [Alphaproteobacteria bacterium]
MTKKYDVLDKVNSSADVNELDKEQLKQLCDDVRNFMIETVSKTGGHLGAGLGVVELSVALHKVFTTPNDKIIWDVGHQAYPHKIITGRKNKLSTIRQAGGLSGFTKRSESLDDCFGAGHSSTSISAGLGMAVARDLKDGENNVVSVIGDGALSAGMAYEALNNAGALKNRLIVILNDNDMSIAPPVGAISGYLSKLISSSGWLSARNIAKNVAHKMPNNIAELAGRFEEYARGMFTGGTLFEELGFYYVGPIDGHNMDHLLPVLENVRDMKEDRPVLIHVVTKKGHGYEPAEKSHDKYHGVSKFCVQTGKQEKSQSNISSYTQVFGETLSNIADKDDKIVAITAAMPSGTGLNYFAKKHPDKTFDVAIAEQHAVTFGAGLACEGYKPFVAIYSTFLQRAYDQVIHDVAVQNLPVKFAIDRAGLVGADGATHAGMFDLAYLSTLPNMVVMAPSDEYELACMVKTANDYNDGPIAFRYPRGEGIGVNWQKNIKSFEIGKGKIVQQGKKVAILSIGTRLPEVKIASEILNEKHGIKPTIADMRFVKPLDKKLISKIVKSHDVIITIEEGVRGGFGAMVLHYLSENDLLNGKKIRTMTLPDEFQDHCNPRKQYDYAKLNSGDIVKQVLKGIK